MRYWHKTIVKEIDWCPVVGKCHAMLCAIIASQITIKHKIKTEPQFFCMNINRMTLHTIAVIKLVDRVCMPPIGRIIQKKKRHVLRILSH